jgi:AcrR family transcriptional regulator
MTRTYTAATDQRSPDAPARARIVAAAYDLFSRHGIKGIGIDRIVAEAPVAKMSLYHHFHSKDDLVLAVLDRREQLWTDGWLRREIERRGGSPVESLIAIFDAYHDWFRDEEFEGCLFINTLLEAHGRDNAIGAAAARHMSEVRSIVATLSEQAGARDAEGLAAALHLLMCGAIVVALAGDRGAARRARAVAVSLLEEEGLTRANA